MLCSVTFFEFLSPAIHTSFYSLFSQIEQRHDDKNASGHQEEEQQIGRRPAARLQLIAPRSLVPFPRGNINRSHRYVERVVFAVISTALHKVIGI